MEYDGQIVGEWPPEPERDRQRKGVGHSTGFELALENALEKWEPGAAERMSVALEVDVKDNPGGIGTYRVILTPSG